MKTKFKCGDTIRNEKNIQGFVHQIDPNDREFFYDIHWADGTLVWAGKARTEKKCELVHRPNNVVVETRPNGTLRGTVPPTNE